jgi:hypothetical protein
MTETTREILGKPGDGVPPYVPFSTFRNFLEKISLRVPSRIDQSVMPRTSRAIRFQLAAALRYLGLVTSDGSRTETLMRLAKARGDERRRIFGEIVRAAYPYLFGPFDLATCTTSQIHQEFKRRASGSTVRKCVAFFVAACRDAGVEISPHIKPFGGTGPGVQKSATSSSDELFSAIPSLERPERADVSAVQDIADWRVSLVLKFPQFDPAWSEEIKSKWFDHFGKLMEYVVDGPKHS